MSALVILLLFILNVFCRLYSFTALPINIEDLCHTMGNKSEGGAIKKIKTQRNENLSRGNHL